MSKKVASKTGEYNTGRENSGDYNSGNENSGDYNSGNGNSGYSNTGWCNLGDENTGSYNIGGKNTGVFNSGHQNTGNYNAGDCNSGSFNTGDWNNGHDNFGDWNAGNGNLGDRNTGCYNLSDNNTGHFNTHDVDTVIYMFNKPVDKRKSAVCLPKLNLKSTDWIRSDDMTEKEKQENPGYEVTGGYLKKLSYKEAWALTWQVLSDGEKIAFQKLPNFDPIIFKEITGIGDLEKVEVIVNGTKKQIPYEDAKSIGLVK